MELIDKSKLLEELKRCEKICEDYMSLHQDAVSQGIANAKRVVCQHFIKFLDTLETKEVNLVKNKKEDETSKLAEEDIKNLNRISTVLYEAGEVQCWWREERLISKEESDYLCNWLKSFYNKLNSEDTEKGIKED